VKGTVLDLMEDSEIIKISLVITPLCLVRKVKCTERLQSKVADNRYETRGVNNMLYELGEEDSTLY
jgi:hypothetical protein